MTDRNKQAPNSHITMEIAVGSFCSVEVTSSDHPSRFDDLTQILFLPVFEDTHRERG